MIALIASKNTARVGKIQQGGVFKFFTRDFFFPGVSGEGKLKLFPGVAFFFPGPTPFQLTLALW